MELEWNEFHFLRSKLNGNIFWLWESSIFIFLFSFVWDGSGSDGHLTCHRIGGPYSTSKYIQSKKQTNKQINSKYVSELLPTSSLSNKPCCWILRCFRNGHQSNVLVWCLRQAVLAEFWIHEFQRLATCQDIFRYQLGNSVSSHLCENLLG